MSIPNVHSPTLFFLSLPRNKRNGSRMDGYIKTDAYIPYPEGRVNDRKERHSRTGRLFIYPA